ncbi:MAG: ABC transporter ATP-binding protein [Candidatus Kariarchaeaceae archaeon]|jgi:ABC-type lipoprotein export system ATPase subunit
MKFQKEKEILGSFTTAVLVDWRQEKLSKSIQKSLRKNIKRHLKVGKIRHSRINTFNVCYIELHQLPSKEERIVLERELQNMYVDYATKVAKIYKKSSFENGEFDIYNNGYKELGYKELKNYSTNGKNANAIKSIEMINDLIKNSSVGLWDYPQEFHVNLNGTNSTLQKDKTPDLHNFIDTFIIGNLASLFLEHSRNVLKLPIDELEELNEHIGKSNLSITSGKLKGLLRNFIGTLSGFQELLKLFNREVTRVYEMSSNSLVTIVSLQLAENNIVERNKEYYSEFYSHLKNINNSINTMKPVLRKWLENNDREVTDGLITLLPMFIDLKENFNTIKRWTYHFEDLASYITLPDTVAFEEVEGEKYYPSPDTSILEATRIFKRFRVNSASIYVLRGVDVSIRQGEFVVIQGPSGGGKTTLLSILSGLDEPERGTVFYKGEDIFKMSDSKLTDLRLENYGFIFQDYALIPHLTTFENAKIPLDITGFSLGVKNRIKELLKDVEIDSFSTHKPANLSGGQMQRLAIVRSLVNKPSIIFADEPTGNLDEATSQVVMELLKYYHEETGVTIIMVSHDKKIAKYGTRQIFLKDGLIVSDLK